MKDELPSDELIAAERPAFEVWCKSEGIDTALWIKDQPQCGYTNARTTDYWTGWIARALLAEQARTEPTNLMGWIYEDSLPDAYPYHAMFPHSAVIDGVRMFPVYAPAQPLKAEQAKDAAEDAELLDRYGKIRGDLKASAYCVGNEYKPFHPGASHVRPEWRDGWNACYVAAIRAARAAERKA